MLFNSFIFAGLLLATFALYYFPMLSAWQVQVLILSSLVFYAYANPALVLLLFFSASINIIVSYFIVNGKTKRRKTLVTLGVALNLLLLAFFKYSPLIAVSFLPQGILSAGSCCIFPSPLVFPFLLSKASV